MINDLNYVIEGHHMHLRSIRYEQSFSADGRHKPYVACSAPDIASDEKLVWGQVTTDW